MKKFKTYKESERSEDGRMKSVRTRQKRKERIEKRKDKSEGWDGRANGYPTMGVL